MAKIEIGNNLAGLLFILVIVAALTLSCVQEHKETMERIQNIHEQKMEQAVQEAQD